MFSAYINLFVTCLKQSQTPIWDHASKINHQTDNAS